MVDRAREYINRQHKWDLFALIINKPPETFNRFDSDTAFRVVRFMRHLTAEKKGNEITRKAYKRKKDELILIDNKLPKSYPKRLKKPQLKLQFTAASPKPVPKTLAKLIDVARKLTGAGESK